jgi:hypothetical protein
VSDPEIAGNAVCRAAGRQFPAIELSLMTFHLWLGCVIGDNFRRGHLKGRKMIHSNGLGAPFCERAARQREHRYRTILQNRSASVNRRRGRDRVFFTGIGDSAAAPCKAIWVSR